jgi:hypothetical protein
MEQVITYEEPKDLAIKVKNVKHVSFGVYSIILKKEAHVSVSCETVDDVIISWSFKLQGEDYLNWKDDEYLFNYIKDMINKMTA